MINEFIRYRVEPAQTEAFVEAYQRASASLQASPHCLGYELSRHSDSAGQFILLIRWDSAEGHMKGFRSSPEFRAFLHEVQPYLANIEEMQHYEPTSLCWSR